MPGINGDFFNKFLTAAQKAQAQQTAQNENHMPVDEIEEMLNGSIFDVTGNQEIPQDDITANIFSLNVQSEIDLKNSKPVSDGRISEIVNTVEDYENLIDAINNGSNYFDEEEYSREYDLRPKVNNNVVSEVSEIDLSEAVIPSEVSTKPVDIEENSLLENENQKLSNFENGSLIEDEKSNTRSYYNLDGENTANMASVNFVVDADGAKCQADYNGLTSDGKAVKGKIEFDVDEHTGTLNGKPVTVNPDTGVVTFDNPEDALSSGESESNTAGPVLSSRLDKNIDRNGNIITSVTSHKDNSVSYYSEKGNKIAETGERMNIEDKIRV